MIGRWWLENRLVHIPHRIWSCICFHRLQHLCTKLSHAPVVTILDRRYLSSEIVRHILCLRIHTHLNILEAYCSIFLHFPIFHKSTWLLRLFWSQLSRCLCKRSCTYCCLYKIRCHLQDLVVKDILKLQNDNYGISNNLIFNACTHLCKLVVESAKRRSHRYSNLHKLSLAHHFDSKVHHIWMNKYHQRRCRNMLRRRLTEKKWFCM